MLRLLPWKFLVQSAARRYGILDPVTLLARLRGFAQPSEVAEPLELLRAGIIFHARGLVNSKAIQHNLDWVWPFWVHRQFSPGDRSFVPRAFSFSHINLTHRNWTAVGWPGLACYPLVDPRGMVTALHDGWSLDFWVVTDAGQRLLPSTLGDDAVSQCLLLEPNLRVHTRCEHQGMDLDLNTTLEAGADDLPQVLTTVAAQANADGWLIAAIRPYNPEGIQFIHRIEADESRTSFRVNGEATVRLDDEPLGIRMAHYADGDVYLNLPGLSDQRSVHCKVGMATCAAMFRLTANVPRRLAVTVSLERDLGTAPRVGTARQTWAEALQGGASVEIPDARMQYLYDAAMRTLLLLSADDLVPGPYTYRRFWFRDACLMLHALLVTGHLKRAQRIIDGFPRHQSVNGHFLSQDGEWDSNGQVLWIAARWAELTRQRLSRSMDHASRRAVHWLASKRNRHDKPPGVAGLLPAGFSAEHLGPNDYYYWDDYWAWGGLQAIARYWQAAGDAGLAREAAALAAAYGRAIEDSLAGIPQARAKGAIPAAPGRRLDAGAIGSMVADYPLHIYPAGEARIMKTAEFLMARCFYAGGFFQEMIHSGINAYLTLDLAQTLLRAGDGRYADLMRRVAELASPTAQWPEAIHPQTFGGCMGDGQHGWAAAEWLMMIRNCFVREDSNELIIASGVLPEWLAAGEISFGPTPTRWGCVSVRLGGDQLMLDTDWHAGAPPPAIRIAVPGHQPIAAEPGSHRFHLRRL